jgi:hypothetical protein
MIKYMVKDKYGRVVHYSPSLSLALSIARMYDAYGHSVTIYSVQTEEVKLV